MHTLTYTRLEQARSTNDYAKQHAHRLAHGTVVYTHCQTAGRGQRGNSWEAEPGKNLTFSLLLKPPGIEARRQFDISVATSLAIVDALATVGVKTSVKWPNDIYCGDGKLAGILIEHSLVAGTAAIGHTVIGVGLNVNQTHFTSDAPNPVSLAMLTGREHDVDLTLRLVAESISHYCRQAADCAVAMLERYNHSLYRADGRPHPFLPAGRRPVQAVISHVGSDGTLTLRDPISNQLSSYAFGEVKHIINHVGL